MIKINKEKTYLHLFEDHSKLHYSFGKKTKWIGWFLLCMLSILILFLPQIPMMLVIGVGAGIISVISSVDVVAMSQEPLAILVLTLMTTSISILGFFVYVKFVERRPFYTIGLRQPKRLFKYLIGALIAIAMQLTYFTIVILLGYGEIVKEPIISTNGIGFSAIGIVLLALVMFLIQGASEEIMVRGWLFPVLAKNYKALTAIIISSALFMALHLANNDISVMPLLNLFLYGVFAVMYALNEGGLWGIFAFHSIWNWFMGNIIGLPVSGQILGGASIIETKLVGPEFITGGGFGPEGGIVVSILLVVGIIVLTNKCFNKGILTIYKSSETNSDNQMNTHEQIESEMNKERDEKQKIALTIKSANEKQRMQELVIERSNGEIEMDFH